MSLLIIISISSFLWVNSLIKAVENGHADHSQSTYLSQFGLNFILYKRLNTYVKGDKEWQEIAKLLAKTDGEVAYNLARYYIDKQIETSHRARNIELWLSQAIRLGHRQARILLAKIYVGHGKLSKAKKLLLPIKSDPSALMPLIEISISMGTNKETERYAQNFKTISSINKNEEQQLFYRKLDKYNVINGPSKQSETSCLASIAPFATNLENLAYFEKLISSSTIAPFKKYLCFSPVKYISKIELDCRHDLNEAIRCNESIWKDNTLAVNNRYVAVLIEKGGANVNKGILYLDSNDNEDVFFHELAHLLGFIDEYPLSKDHFRCSAVQNSMFSHNIAILPRFYQGSREAVREKVLKELPWSKYISSKTRLVSSTSQGWKLGSVDEDADTVGAFLAETCNEKDFVAIKPLNQRTTLRYYEENFPALYWKILADDPKKFLLPSYLKNVMMALKAKK